MRLGCKANLHNASGNNILHLLSTLDFGVLFPYLSVILNHGKEEEICSLLSGVDKENNTFLHLLASRSFSMPQSENETNTSSPQLPFSLEEFSLLYRLIDHLPSALLLPNNEGNVPLYVAAEKSNEIFLRFLLSISPSSVWMENLVEKTSLDIAFEKENQSCLRTLWNEAIHPPFQEENVTRFIAHASTLNHTSLLSILTIPPSPSQIFIFNPPAFRRCLRSFTSENDLEVSVHKGDVLLLYFETLFGWCFVQTGPGSKGMVPSRCLRRLDESEEGEGSKEKRHKLDSLVADRASLYYTLDLNGEIKSLLVILFNYNFPNLPILPSCTRHVVPGRSHGLPLLSEFSQSPPRFPSRLSPLHHPREATRHDGGALLHRHAQE